ncbi:MAG: hypothetical protein QM765_26455 [Myxococcales bacterium]
MLRTLLLALVAVLVSACPINHRGDSPDGSVPANDGGPVGAVDAGTSADAGQPDTGPLPPPLGTTLTTVTLADESGGTAERTRLPVTFAQAFKPGDVPAGARVAARLASGPGVALQADEKARHADGSLRHAVLTAQLPSLAGGGSQKVELVATNDPLPGDPPVAAAALLSGSFDAVVSLVLSDGTYTASAKELLGKDASRRWIEGSQVTEWTLSAPVTNGSAAHPHLTARFDVRAYAGGSVRVDVIVENGWAYVPAPQNVTYDAAVSINGAPVWSKAGIEHGTHARWRKTFWVGSDPQVGVHLDPKYLLSTGAVPHYDPELTIAEAALAAYATKGSVEPMEIGLPAAYMPTTGGRPDIGPLPAWSVCYLLSGDPRARRAMLATADGAGAWPIHYRNEKTDRPVTLDDYPYMTLLGNPGDTYNPATKQHESFPACGGACASPFTPDSSHQPSLVYLPYLVTGDRYYLDELEFWANWNLFQSNPGYRGAAKGLLKPDQVRGQAWSLRTLAQAAYVVPDTDPQKANFTTRLANNLTDYATRYQQSDSVLGINSDGAAFAYENGRGIAPWQDDFFTWAVGHAVELGFAEAAPLLAYKARFSIGRMTADGYCWIDGAPYFMLVRASSADPLYTSFAEAWQATVGDKTNASGQRYGELACASQAMADWRSAVDGRTWKVGEMTGYADSASGYPSNMQPALAVAADSGVAKGPEAWQRFMGRSVKPDYSHEPQFAVVPRTVK